MDVEALKIAVYRRLPPRLRQSAIRLSTPNFSVGVMVFLTDDCNRVLLVRTTYREGWLPPGGFLDRGESAEVAMRRELREELALDVTVQPPHRVYLDVERQGVTFVVTARLLPDQVPRLMGPELSQWQWFSLDEIPPLSEEFHEGILAEDVAAVRRMAD